MICLKIKVNVDLSLLDLFFIFSFKKGTGNSQGLICLSNNSAVSQATFIERKQIMSTSLDSIS